MNKAKLLHWGSVVLLIVPGLFFMLLAIQMNAGYLQQIKDMKAQKTSLAQQIDSLQTDLADLNSDYDAVSRLKISRIIATAYNSDRWQTDTDPFVTSSGAKVSDGTLALSRDLIRAETGLMHKMGFNPSGTYAYGDTLYMVYVKPMVLHDTMNKRYKDRADIWLKDYHTAREWGKREVFLVSRGGS